MSLLLKVVEAYAWVAFALAWIHMGWVDWTKQKIRNRYLGFWLKLILLGYAVVLLHSLLGRLGLVPVYLLGGYYLALAGYVAVCAAAAWTLWRLGIWPAGDVKLFVLLALFYPLMRVPGSFHSGLRFLEVLINVFVPASAFLFLTASAYLWRTRFKHQKEFLIQLGFGRLTPYLAHRSREALSSLKQELRDWVETCRDPRRLLLNASAWLGMMAVMSLISYTLSDVIRSNFLKTVVCFALFFAWSRLCLLIGKRGALALAAGIFALLLLRRGQLDWALLGAAFGHISVFSLCLFFGIQIAFKVVAGQTGFLVLPVLFMLPSLIPWQWLKGLSLPAFSLGIPASPFSGLATWALMGLFFGLSLVFVRIWDAESFTSVSPRQIVPYMSLGPAILSRLQEDQEFYERHFSRLYPDGLTQDQADALREWCTSRGVAVVPLAPTISFANWIFFGYLLTLLMDGHVLRLVY